MLSVPKGTDVSANSKENQLWPAIPANPRKCTPTEALEAAGSWRRQRTRRGPWIARKHGTEWSEYRFYVTSETCILFSTLKLSPLFHRSVGQFVLDSHLNSIGSRTQRQLLAAQGSACRPLQDYYLNEERKMTQSLTLLAAVALLAFGAWDVSRKRWLAGSIQVLVSVTAFFAARRLTTVLPAAFGPSDGFALIAILLVSAALGSMAQEYWRSSAVSVRDTLRAVVVTPITVLPLYQVAQHSTADGASETLILLALLAFQNGFFWRAVITKQEVALKAAQQPGPATP